MSFAIIEWNLNPNRNWYVKLADAGSDISVKLYATQADAAADTNVVAEGTAEFGTDSESTLIMKTGGTPEISLFNEALTYHIKVSGADSDAQKTYKITPFVDLPGINHNIYRSETLIQQKAITEINSHTHTSKIRDIGIAAHIPELKTGDTINIQSALRDINVLSTTTEVLIIATPDTLINQIETVQYIDLSHE